MLVGCVRPLCLDAVCSFDIKCIGVLAPCTVILNARQEWSYQGNKNIFRLVEVAGTDSKITTKQMSSENQLLFFDCDM